MTPPPQIGFSQRIQIEWMEQTASLVLAGMARQEIKHHLQESLRTKLSVGGKAQRGNREKAISILLRIWLVGPAEWPIIRQRGLDLLKSLPIHERLPIHWGMSMAAYPFFGSVAEVTGRLLNLQETVTSVQVQRRLRERYGERETVHRAARRVLSVFTDWGVLQRTTSKGVFRLRDKPYFVQQEEVMAWMLTARLAVDDGNPQLVHSLVQSPSFFPFHVQIPSLRMLNETQGLHFVNHGFDDQPLIGLEA